MYREVRYCTERSEIVQRELRMTQMGDPIRLKLKSKEAEGAREH